MSISDAASAMDREASSGSTVSSQSPSTQSKTSRTAASSTWVCRMAVQLR